MIEELATLLMNKTCMERFNRAEVESVLTFLSDAGYLVDPNAVTPEKPPAWDAPTMAASDGEQTNEEQPIYD